LTMSDTNSLKFTLQESQVRNLYCPPDTVLKSST
jgi:hypothetical protein